MKESIFQTPLGDIHYWISEAFDPARTTLLFLPGLTADHRLFEKQTQCFVPAYNVLVWDAPGHNMSRPFTLDFTLADKAAWLDAILEQEGIRKPVLIGQSMGGYAGQAYMQQFPGKLAGFVSVDSAPLQRKYMKQWEITAMKRVEPVYAWYPWRLLLKSATRGTAETAYGRSLMREMMMSYADDKKAYARLVGHGYRMLAQAVEADLPYEIDCPALLLCGEKDKAGETRRFNRAWAKGTGLRLEWIPDAGHNSNTDQPELVNRIIDEFVRSLA